MESLSRPEGFNLSTRGRWQPQLYGRIRTDLAVAFLAAVGRRTSLGGAPRPVRWRSKARVEGDSLSDPRVNARVIDCRCPTAVGPRYHGRARPSDSGARTRLARSDLGGLFSVLPDRGPPSSRDRSGAAHKVGGELVGIPPDPS